MAWQDDIAEKRKEAATLKASQASHRESIDAISGSGEGIVAATNKLATKTDISGVVNELRLMGHRLNTGFDTLKKSLDNQLDVSKLVDSIQGLDASEHNASEIGELKQIKTELAKLTSPGFIKSKDYTKSLSALLSAVEAIKLTPIVNVPETVINLPEPKVTIKEKTVDLKPLQDTLRQYMERPESESVIDLECYVAQDINDYDKNTQYVGFINPEGEWYIIENDVKGNKLRYIFGQSDYTKAFSKASSYKYSLLNEAINALQA